MGDDLDELLRGPVARDVYALLQRALIVHVRTNGASTPGWAEPVLRALADRADLTATLPRSVAGTTGGTVAVVDPDMVELSTAADQAGRSPEYIRRLCRQGRVRCRRVGPVWVVDQQSLNRVLGRSAA